MRGLPHAAPPKHPEDAEPESPLNRIFVSVLEPGDLSIFLAAIWTGIIFVWIGQQYQLLPSSPVRVLSTKTKNILRCIAVFYILHYAMIIINRWSIIGVMALYEGLWVCSLALIMASIGIFTERYHYVAAAVSSVLTGHVIW